VKAYILEWLAVRFGAWEQWCLKELRRPYKSPMPMPAHWSEDLPGGVSPVHTNAIPMNREYPPVHERIREARFRRATWDNYAARQEYLHGPNKPLTQVQQYGVDTLKAAGKDSNAIKPE
jgi:hypothetical protein